MYAEHRRYAGKPWLRSLTKYSGWSDTVTGAGDDRRPRETHCGRSGRDGRAEEQRSERCEVVQRSQGA